MTTDTQMEVAAFLMEPANWHNSADASDQFQRADLAETQAIEAQVIETHCARVFLAGDTALKVRRDIRLPYLDYSTLEARHAMAKREIALNQPFAPDIYLGLVAITRTPDGRLAIDGDGDVVEWAVRMRRFGQDCLVSHIADRQGISRGLAVALADMVVRMHKEAVPSIDACDRTPDTIAAVLGVLTLANDARVVELATALAAELTAAADASAAVRLSRAQAGHVRRCHGDLHLGNIVLWNGVPLPFDALEFDEALATIDTLYDLAFLLMDLERRGQRAAANIVLSRYVWRTGDDADVAGLRALPVFLSLRAAVRAMAALERVRLEVGGQDQTRETLAHVIETLQIAHRHLDVQRARLIVIGGLSGTGKTTLASTLAPVFGRSPGALHLRTDLERKALAGVSEFDRLPPSSYTAQTARLVFDRVLRRARLALEAGHSVIVDGVFAREDERRQIEIMARETGASFDGVWLDAAADIIRARVAARRDDASDATPEVVDRQLNFELGDVSWLRLDASESAAQLATDARRPLGL